ncbi:MAG: PilW family protein [Rhodocyclaceae bacterium]|nr:PilW family protein [Rhodocyclaceae bacterium]
MFTMLAVMNVMASFEGQKRTTSGTADAQTNGSIALYTLQRNIQAAGFDLPTYNAIFRPLNCTPEPLIAQGAINIGIYPVFITDGGAGGASDTITVLGSYNSALVPGEDIGQATSGVPTRITGIAGSDVSLTNNYACRVGDIVLTMQSSQISPTPACTLKTVTALIGTTQVTLDDTTGISVGDGLSCMRGWTQRAYSVVNNTLLENATPIASDIVSLQAQYGISAVAADNQIANWVDATGAWAAPSVDDRKRIKAIRLAVIARSNLLERDPVSQACSSLNTPAPTGVCAWVGTATDPAPNLALDNNAAWTRYRYRVFETIMPLRNIITNMNTI